VVAKLFGRGIQVTGKVFSEGGQVVGDAGKRLHTTADLYEEADGKGAGLLKKLHPDSKGKVDPRARCSASAAGAVQGTGNTSAQREYVCKNWLVSESTEYRHTPCMPRVSSTL
jgi:hypothetical protein